jgi:hypothetical protein
MTLQAQVQTSAQVQAPTTISGWSALAASGIAE